MAIFTKENAKRAGLVLAGVVVGVVVAKNSDAIMGAIGSAVDKVGDLFSTTTTETTSQITG